MRASFFLLVGVVSGCGARTPISLDPDGTDSVDAGPPRDARVDVGPPLMCRNDLECDDGLVCNGFELCEREGCVAQSLLRCDDGIGCTTDSCTERLGGCQSVPDNSRCPRGSRCVLGEGCVGDTVPCRSNLECDDGDRCNGSESCEAGVRVSGPALLCPPSDECAESFCDPDLGECVFEPLDRDGDGFGAFNCGGDDCDDEDPRRNPGVPERCGNARDDDCDGAIDCEDDACAGMGDCSCRMSEICGGNADADCDGSPGCADTDCVNHPACSFECMPELLGGMTGMGIASGSTVGSPDRWQPSCAGGTGGDRLYEWQAPSAGAWVFDTFGSRYDTAIVVLASCGGPELDCNDDTRGTDSRVVVELDAGQTVIIVIDGWSGSEGDFVLNIRAR